MGLTTDPSDPRLGHGVDDEPGPQNELYLVAKEDDLVRPIRYTYIHARELGGCGVVTSMNEAIARTYAQNPSFYGATYCVGCRKHLPVGENGEFYWGNTKEKVGT